MTRAAMLAALIVGIAMQPAAAEPFYREDLRIPMEAAGPRGLEAMLLRPSGTRRYPLALISHGTPREGSARAPMSPYGSYRQALEFARRGFAALVFMRRGYGDSGGQYAESSGPCGQREYLRSAWRSASDLRAAVEAMGSRTDVSTNGMIAVGVSAGGFASLALTANAPPGLAAAINFAGGPQLRDKGRAGFSDYLSASPHRAFAVSPKGAFAFRSGRRSTREAAEAALTACAEYAADCALYAVDDHLAETANAGSR